MEDIKVLHSEKSSRVLAKEQRHSVPYRLFCFVHHISVLCLIGWFVSMGPLYWPSILSVVVWWVYSDVYSAILHCALDDPRALHIPLIKSVAKGFQEHHIYPIESTMGKGIYQLFSDTVRIHWVVTSLAFMISSKRDTGTLLQSLLKTLTCAYGTQVGHYYAHCSQDAPVAIKWLQKTHLLLPPAHHWGHHKEPYSVNFGIVNGLSNRVMNIFLKTTGPLYNFYVVTSLWAVLTVFDIVVAERLFSN